MIDESTSIIGECGRQPHPPKWLAWPMLQIDDANGLGLDGPSEFLVGEELVVLVAGIQHVIEAGHAEAQVGVLRSGLLGRYNEKCGMWAKPLLIGLS